ncbi:MAG TPA: CpXC domain-containing protein [Kofleriaceae bacterium]|nr:CpXC domain-containing protein [Kofleriaceae bacterium]
MSTFVPAKIACRCGETYPVEVANGLHISLRPDLRKQILDGEFHRFRCPRCATITQIDGLLAFTDFPRRQWFTVAPGNGLPWRKKWLALARESFETTMERNAPPMVVGWAREMTRRLIFGLASLREKLVIFDAGLDDRVVELLKIQLIRDSHDDFSPARYFHLTEVRSDTLVLERAQPDGMVRAAPIPRVMYDALAGAPELAASIDLAFPDGLLVDHRAILVPEAEGSEQLGA